jgi:aspartyl-tRNA(Asn)/glutamyl-tRNA(Gln) amidotransferase subunit A
MPLFEAALAKLRELGAQMEDVALSEDYPYQAVLNVTDYCEGASSFEDLVRDGRFEEFASRNRGNNWAAGLSITAVDYLRAQRIRTDIIRYTKTLFGKYDALVAPNNVAPAGPVGAGGSGGRGPAGATDGPPRHLGNLCNITGVTFLSTRCGFKDDMPIGIKFVGPHFGESTVLELAHAYEQGTDWKLRQAEYKD